MFAVIKAATLAATTARAALKKITTNVPPVTILDNDDGAADCDKKTLGAVRRRSTHAAPLWSLHAGRSTGGGAPRGGVADIFVC